MFNMDKLKPWYESEGYDVNSFADKLKVSPNAVYKWLSGERCPNGKTQKAIFLLSGGKITPNDWVL